jgi:DNA-binding LytR/AlgR family response regulator
MYRILAIDNDEIWQLKLQIILEELGHKVDIASSLKMASQMLLTFSYDIFFTEVMLPDGLATQYFTDNPTSEPVIFYSEVSDKVFADQTVQFPNALFYVKPLNVLSVHTAIETLIKNVKKQTDNSLIEATLPVSVHYGTVNLLQLKNIKWITVEGNYTTIVTTEKRYVQKVSLKKIKILLDERFVQVNKTTVINKLFITNVNAQKNEVNIGKEEFNISRAYRKAFIQHYFSS